MNLKVVNKKNILLMGFTFIFLLNGCLLREDFFDTLNNPDISVKQGATGLPNETGRYDFGSVKVNTSKEVEITIENKGGVPLNIEGIAITYGDSDQFHTSFSSTLSIVEATGSTTFSIIFLPTLTGHNTATVRIESDDPDDGIYTFTINGYGEPNVGVKHNGSDIPDGSGSYNYNSVVSGFSSAPQTFTIENNGLEVVNITDVYLSSGDTTDFFIDDSLLSDYISPGEYTSFDITFTPLSTGQKTVTTSIRFYNPDENIYTFTVTGYGQQPLPDINLKQGAANLIDGTGTYDFGNIIIGNSSPEIVFTIENTGTADLSLYNISSSAPSEFTIDNATVDWTLQPGSAATFTIEFSPASLGVKNETITIVNDDPDEDPFTFTVEGVCVAVPAPEIRINRSGVNIPSGSLGYDFGQVVLTFPDPEVTFTIRNNGNEILNIYDITISAGDFSLSSPSIPFIISAGSSRDFPVTFSPSVTGAHSALVTVTNDDSDESVFTFDVTGECIDPEPDIHVKKGVSEIPIGAQGHDFGSIEIGNSSVPVSFSIENTGTSDLIINDLYLDSASFTIDYSTMASIIPGGGATTFAISFVPDSSGTKSATVTILNNDADKSPYTFTVTGNGIQPPDIIIGVKVDSTVIPNGSTFDFGNVDIGSPSVVIFTIVNDGTETLQITNILLTDGDPAVFTRDISSTSFEIEPSSSTDFTVTFDPLSDVYYWRNLEINSNDIINSPHRIKLEGDGKD